MRPKNLRPCFFSKEVTDAFGCDRGYFHEWDHRSEIHRECGGFPAGVVARTLGIIELEDGRIVEVSPDGFMFADAAERPGKLPDGQTQE